jgi:transcription initiation factor TFIIIB Brf1 subunit/transcription initiation factor TFIIB
MDLEQLLEQIEEQRENKLNYCPDCDVPLVIAAECKCPICNQTFEYQEARDSAPTSGVIRMPTAGGRYCRIGVNNNYAEAQEKSVLQLLYRYRRINAETPGGVVLPENILKLAAQKYNEMQRADTASGKKFVRRAGVKSQVLCALLMFICTAEGIPRKPSEIARFMSLDIDGFSQGETIVRSMVSAGAIELNVEIDPSVAASAYVYGYLETLGCTPEQCDNWSKMSREIFTIAHENRVAPRLKIPSRAAGAVYIINMQANLGFKNPDIEKAVTTKKATYNPFVLAVVNHKHLFNDTLVKFGLPAIK